MRNWVKYLVGFFFILSILFYWLIQFYQHSDDIELRNQFVMILHKTNYFLFFPLLLTVVFMHYFRKRNEFNLWDYFTTWLILQTFTILFNHFPLYLDFCGFEDTETLYVSEKTPNKIIVNRAEDCGIFDAGGSWIQLKQPYLLIFNKYEEIDTNTLDLTHWKRL